MHPNAHTYSLAQHLDYWYFMKVLYFTIGLSKIDSRNESYIGVYIQLTYGFHESMHGTYEQQQVHYKYH